MRAWTWRLQYYWRKLFVHDGIHRSNPSKMPVEPRYSALVLYYPGEPGDEYSDTPIAYKLVTNDRANH